ncbi:MAG: glycosyltransferase [Raoultibacter sp.]
MRFFVASWFFPPSTSSEGIVTYKLFRNSRHTYDVCCSESKLWSYKHSLPLNADNIHTFPVKTDDIDDWVEKAIEVFEEEHARNPYDALMTRSMPPESIFVAKKIREKYPEIPWIASLADPIANNPYQIKEWIIDNKKMSDSEKFDLRWSLANGCDTGKITNDPNIQHLSAMKEIEDYAVDTADALIFPCDTLKSYTLGSKQRRRAYSIPHSFDQQLYPSPETADARSDKTTFTFLGHSDPIRSLKPLVLALNHLKNTQAPLLEKLHIRFIGHVPEDVSDLIYNFHLHNTISVEASVDYLTSLKIMQETDWLVHVDAKFDFLSETGGSIFFAGKIADYMGTDAPILGITGRYSPAYEIIQRAGGMCVDPEDIREIADTLARIAESKITPPIDGLYRASYAASCVACDFDDKMEALVNKDTSFSREFWPEVQESAAAGEKVVTICIPAYNVESYLDRCLFSLLTCKNAANLEILIVNDGSKDGTAEIACRYEEHYPSIIKLINKENGGHGSTINTALALAQGTYFRIIDGDDWVDSKSFDKLLGNIIEEHIDVDLISSNYYQIYFEDGHAVPWMKIGASPDYLALDFASSDFSQEYFTMAAVMFKTSVLRQPAFKIQEHTFYVDVEYLLYPIPYTHTVMFTPEYIYRYAVGNADQSINPNTFTKKYDHHDRVIRRMLSYFEDHKPTMGQGQLAYMKSLFAHRLLQSHYLLSLVWDTDRQRGLDRAKNFDAFLKQTDGELWKACGKYYAAVHTARKKGFDPNRIKPPGSLEDGGRGPRALILKALGRLKKTDFADKLAANESLRKAYRKVLPR